MNATLVKLCRTARTVRYLKTQQIAGQIYQRVIRSFARYGNVNDEGVAVYPGCAWPNGVEFLAPGAQDNRAETIRGGALTFLNSQVRVGFPPRWDGGGPSKLWQYNLHYFEWLWALGYEDARRVVCDWIAKHPAAKGAVGWEPYPTSLRLMNWCAVFWGKFREQLEADHDLLPPLWASMVRQTGWLERHLETHLLGNHYLENGAALAVVGSCFTGSRARTWFKTGCGILHEQISEQILPDGMHFELSPMYHSRAAYVLATLAATGNKWLTDMVTEPLLRMLQAMDCLCHPDGGIALSNDSAFGICNEPHPLRCFCRRLLADHTSGAPRSPGCFALPDAGYYGWCDPEGNYILCDFGRIGPDYLPGHAHADIFSFELSLWGNRVIVDAGVHDYEVSEERGYCRSTAAHNTVEINDQDQCEMWGAFRVARRGYPQEVLWWPSTDGFFLRGQHDGYRRLPGRPVHRRTIEWDRVQGLAVTDRITSSRAVKAISRLHLHPRCTIAAVNEACIEIASPGGRVCIRRGDGCAARIEEGWHFPQFGLKERNAVLAFERTGTDIMLRYHVRSNAQDRQRHANRKRRTLCRRTGGKLVI